MLHYDPGMKKTPRHVEPPSFRIQEDCSAKQWAEIVHTLRGETMGFVHLFIYENHYTLSLTQDENGEEKLLLWDMQKIKLRFCDFVPLAEPKIIHDEKDFYITPTVA